MKKRAVGVNLPEDLLRRIDDLRFEVSRSVFIEQILEAALTSPTSEG